MKLKLKKALPFEFIFDELAGLDYRVKAMFGGYAVYLGEKIIFILREKKDYPQDNGVWIATTAEHHESLQQDFPSMRSISLFGSDGPTGWQNLPAEAVDFEEVVLKFCRFIQEGDERIGKIPKARKKKVPGASKRKAPKKVVKKPAKKKRVRKAAQKLRIKKKPTRASRGGGRGTKRSRK